MFGNKALVDFGTKCKLNNDIAKVNIDKQIYTGYNFNFRIGLTKDALAFVAKHIDKNIPIDKLDYISEYQLVSVGKLGAALIKNSKEYYILTPIGPIMVNEDVKDTSLFGYFIQDVMNVRVENLLKIDLNNGWTEDKILELTQMRMREFGDFDR